VSLVIFVVAKASVTPCDPDDDGDDQDRWRERGYRQQRRVIR
jgi:hypothetical protein